MIDEKDQDGQLQSTRDLVRQGRMDVPEEPIEFPTVGDLNNQIKQLREQASSRPTSTFSTPRSLVTSPSVPRPVSGIHILREPVSGTANVRVHVSFTRDPKDTAFQNANIYLQQGAGRPVLVASTTRDEATSFITNKTNQSSTVIVQSVGTVNNLPIEHSPSRIVTLGGTVGVIAGNGKLPGSGGTEAPSALPTPVGVPPYFNNILTGTNTTADMEVGSGATLGYNADSSPAEQGIVDANEIGGIYVAGNVPTHPGMIPISQPGNTSALWADPQVQGLYAEGDDIDSPPAYTAPTTIQPVLTGVSASDTLYALRTCDTFKTFLAQGGTPQQVGIWTPASGKSFRLMKLWISISGNANTGASGGLMTIYLTDGAAGPVVGPTFDVWIPPTPSGNVFGDFKGLHFSTDLIDMGNGYLSGGPNTTLYLNVNLLLANGYIRVNTFGTEE